MLKKNHKRGGVNRNEAHHDVAIDFVSFNFHSLFDRHVVVMSKCYIFIDLVDERSALNRFTMSFIKMHCFKC